jgi:HEAT repeat protein
VGRLARLQENPRQFAASADALNKMVSDSAGLTVALINALALIGDASVTGKLHQALELEHRGIRVEAAEALAKLGDEAGVEMLVALSGDPVVRPRVAAALEELGHLDKIGDRD